MRLKGQVLKRFSDSQDGNKTYAPRGVFDIEEYTGKKIEYPSVYEAEKDRYEELKAKGYVSEGQAVKIEERPEEKPKERRPINEFTRKFDDGTWR